MSLLRCAFSTYHCWQMILDAFYTDGESTIVEPIGRGPVTPQNDPKSSFALRQQADGGENVKSFQSAGGSTFCACALGALRCKDKQLKNAPANPCCGCGRRISTACEPSLVGTLFMTQIDCRFCIAKCAVPPHKFKEDNPTCECYLGRRCWSYDADGKNSLCDSIYKCSIRTCPNKISAVCDPQVAIEGHNVSSDGIIITDIFQTFWSNRFTAVHMLACSLLAFQLPMDLLLRWSL